MKRSTLIGILSILVGCVPMGIFVIDRSHVATVIVLTAMAFIGVGCYLIDPQPVLEALKSLLGLAAPYLPGGRRDSDPPCRPPS